MHLFEVKVLLKKPETAHEFRKDMQDLEGALALDFDDGRHLRISKRLPIITLTISRSLGLQRNLTFGLNPN